ncbi:glycoside hydrolase family 16 protein [Auriscalpium vulgare]|uniref:Glycoside hydrolase family 16 protein n=1 Tax=Auriscalpium vulgare TaxID=40419 RepID=A0ACB8S423_9AGAM|nr:glycoside hydrolase family 16 protein [Auriscalpium vulgare]
MCRNGEFEMTTASTSNSYIQNGQLCLLPTLTSAVLGHDAIFDGHTFNLTDCINTKLTACGTVRNRTMGTVVNPVMSARISKGKKTRRQSQSLADATDEFRAHAPAGELCTHLDTAMWPAVWMLPENNTYGPWRLSGEIDVMDSRGNSPSYPAQGINYVRGSLNWGPLTWLNAVAKTYGWWTVRRYALEWTDEFLRIYVAGAACAERRYVVDFDGQITVADGQCRSGDGVGQARCGGSRSDL